MDIKLTHNDNHKGKSYSHKVCLKQPEGYFYVPKADISSYNLFDINGYGETKDEATYDLLNKLRYLFEEYRELERLLFKTDILTNNMIEVDCYGKEIVKQS